MVEQTTRSRDDDVRSFANTTFLGLSLLTSTDDGRNNPEEGKKQLLDGFFNLHAQLTRRNED